MLFGLPPFYSKNQNIVFELIEKANVRIPQRPDLVVSLEAQDLILKVHFEKSALTTTTN